MAMSSTNRGGKLLPKIGDEAKGSTVTEILTWQDRRELMTNVCSSCHSSSVVNGHYKQFDDVVNLYNDKFAKPIDGHDWYFNGISKDAVDKVRKGFEERYGKGSMK